jgi:hypothetical protein
VADGSHSDGLSPVGQLIEDSIGADSQRIQASELPAKGVPGERFPLKQTQRILDRIDQRPAQLEQIATSSPGKGEAGQRSASCGPALGQLSAKLSEGDRLPTLELGETSL